MTYAAVYRVLLGVALVAATAAHGGETDTPARRARKAVTALASGDPAERDAAAKTLLDLGAAARRAVARAARSDEPELRGRAASLLLKLPWALPTDSDAVRTLLDQYGTKNVAERRQIVSELARPDNNGFDALARLMVDEPSDDVKWAIVSAVRYTYAGKVLARFRKFEVEADSAPALAAAGHAWLPEDPDHGAKLLRRALELDVDRPANDAGEVEAAYDRLQNLALLNADYDRVADLLRLRARRGATDDDGEPTKAVFDLFAAHANFGPLKGFDADLETYKAQLADPRILFALARLYDRGGSPLLAAATARTAFVIDLVSIGDRFQAGELLLRQGWLDAAEGEFATIFALSDDHSGERSKGQQGDPSMTPEIENANAHFRLARVAAAREDDFDAAEHMRLGMELHYKARGMLRGATDRGLWQDINWHYLRAAQAKGNSIEVQHRLDQLIGAELTNPDIANDVVPLLHARGRHDEAKAMFNQVYESLTKSWGEHLDHPMPKNNLAWLCARTGERPEEALRLAREAVKAMPDNAAFVDTLAEASHLAGNDADAVRLEAKVVAARPTDVFLRQQYLRFQRAAEAKQSKPPK